jgi:hypothetical protein
MKGRPRAASFHSQCLSQIEVKRLELRGMVSRVAVVATTAFPMFVESLPTNMASGASRKRQRFLGEADTDRAAGGGRGTWETL